MKFTEFNLNENLQKGIDASSYVECTPVQEQVLISANDGSDLYVQSQTGTGKTAAYLIAIFNKMLNEPKDQKALILVPTHELAVQVQEEAKSLASSTDFKIESFYGGVGYAKQTDSLKKKIDMIIGTPGRIIDLQEQGLMDLSNVAFLVVDEADRMFDMGFYPELRKILKCVPSSENRQTMLFSATLNTYVKNLAWEYTREPKEIEIESENIVVSEIHQELIHVSSNEKMQLLLGILKSQNPKNVIIFCNTKKSCEIVSKRLKLNGIESEYIIGDLPQSKRMQVLNSFKQGQLSCLVATDVAARGIDVTGLEMVINYDLPTEAENYVHRIGRTARAGQSGKAYTLCSEQDVYNLPAIERYIELAIPASVADPEKMVEDKSNGIYIKLDRESYEENRNSRGKTSRNYHSKGDSRNYDNHHSGNRKYGERNENRSGKYGEKSNYKSKSYKSNSYKNGENKNRKYSENKKFDVDMSSLTFEQRMEIYRKKYGQNSENKNYSGKNQNRAKQNYKKNFDGNKKSTYQKNDSVKNAPEKKLGFLYKIKKLFGKKN